MTGGTNSVTVDGETLEQVECFTLLDCFIDKQGGSDENLKARVGKAREAPLQPKNTWNSERLSTDIKVRIFHTNIETVLLCMGFSNTTNTYELLTRSLACLLAFRQNSFMLA